MEQESTKREAEETEFQTPNAPMLCANNCGFFGSPATNNLCSKCYKACSFATPEASISISVDGLQIEEKSKGKGVDGDAVVDRSVKSEPLRGEAASAFSSGGEAPASNKPKNRCTSCNKKIGLLGFKCRCGGVFCSVHRYADEHNCGFDYRGAGQAEIAKANPIVKADKVDKM